MMMNITIGQKIHKLTVIRFDRSEKSRTFWICLCECGTEKSIESKFLINRYKSCGCLERAALKQGPQSLIKHGMSGTKLYKVWSSMKARCSNPNLKEFKNYGGRGITVCERWMKFENFYQDMGEPPTKHTLERRDNNKGYFKENCYWATWTRQANNKRTNHIIEYGGKSQSIADWAREWGVDPQTLYNQYSH